MNIEVYLKKLNIKSQKPSLEFLNELIKAHQSAISFNNLAVFFNPGKILNLNLDELFEKVVVRGEGGYCFENNKIMYYVLLSLGFEVEPKAGRVIYDKVGDIPRTHRTNVVTVGGLRYLVDVGFGKDVPPTAIPIGQNKTEGHHVILRDNRYLLQFMKKEVVINLYAFDDCRYEESDFTVANYYTNTHPDSKFVKELIVTRRDPDVIEIINGKIYSHIQGANRKDIEIKTQEEFEHYLSKFGITRKYEFTVCNSLPSQSPPDPSLS